MSLLLMWTKIYVHVYIDISLKEIIENTEMNFSVASVSKNQKVTESQAINRLSLPNPSPIPMW